jgi:predicted DNA-binding transcriptional regulator AlpA
LSGYAAVVAERLRLMAMAELTRALGLSASRVHQIVGGDPTFPAPVATLRVGKIWLAADVEEWMRRTGRAAPSPGPPPAG